MFSYDAALAVADYLDSDDVTDAFNQCQFDYDGVRLSFLAEAEEMGVTVTHIHSISFVEFDSPNPHHASGYFDVQYNGSADMALLAEEA